MPLSLVLRTPAPQGATREVGLGGREVVIGRAPAADMVLPDPTQQVSSRHCVLQPRDGGYLLADASTNGTVVNGRRLNAPHRLAAGDRIEVGPYRIEVEERAEPKPAATGMDLSGWDRPAAARPAAPAAAAPPPVRPGPGVTPAAREASLARGLATLVATRARQRQELGVTTADALRDNPLAAAPERAAAALAEAPAAEQAVAAAVDAIERHHAATLHAMRGAFRATLDRFAPQAIARATPDAAATGDARDAALWRAYAAAFAGTEAVERGFVESFAREFRQAYERLTAAGQPSSAARPPS